MKKAFTIAELVVAVGVMAVVMAGTGYIFKVAVDAQRTAAATSEIMRNLRGITDQLNNDFAGVQTDAPMAIWFQQDAPVAGSEPNRYDQILFFAAGDFSSYRAEYGSSNNQILKGNAARIQYGHSRYFDQRSGWIAPWNGVKSKDRILFRSQHILTQDIDCNNWSGLNFANFDQIRNEQYEYDKLSIAQWKLLSQNIFDTKIVPESLANANRIRVSVSDANTFNNLMCKGVGSFAVQWGYRYVDNSASPPINEWRWWPSNNPNGDGDTAKSHFTGTSMMGNNEFGMVFNVSSGLVDWHPSSAATYENGGQPIGRPQALKFTFTLYDSKGIIKNGLKFTHIVYLKN